MDLGVLFGGIIGFFIGLVLARMSCDKEYEERMRDTYQDAHQDGMECMYREIVANKHNENYEFSENAKSVMEKVNIDQLS